jgi:RNA polymerase sigma-70 factor (ECF subfamily)
MDNSPANQVSLHVPRMYRVAYRLLCDADAAHDAVQEACVKALASMGRFNGQATLATWLHRITVNCARDALRSQVRKDRAYAALQSQPADRAPAHSPAEILEFKELTDLAWRLLEALPEDCRSAFALTQLDGYSYDEAAQIEGEPRGTVASRVFRAKRILLDQMNARLDERART